MKVFYYKYNIDITSKFATMQNMVEPLRSLQRLYHRVRFGDRVPDGLRQGDPRRRRERPAGRRMGEPRRPRQRPAGADRGDLRMKGV